MQPKNRYFFPSRGERYIGTIGRVGNFWDVWISRDGHRYRLVGKYGVADFTRSTKLREDLRPDLWEKVKALLAKDGDPSISPNATKV